MSDDNIKNVLASKDYEVNVITSVDGDRINGQIATWVTQVSMEPALMAVCLAPTRYTAELISNSGVLAVNILSREQIDLVPHFGYQSGRDVEKFAEVPYRRGETGCPIIEGVSAYLECRVRETFPGGDRTIYLSEVTAAAIERGGDRINYQWLLAQSQAT